MEAQSYHDIREQLVTLTVELDDRSRVCQVLNTKIEDERLKLSQVESVVENDYQRKLDSLRDVNRSELADMKLSVEQSVAKKKSMIEECRRMVGAIKQQDMRLQEERRQYIEETNAAIEQEKIKFRQESEARRVKIIEDRRREFKETTARALAPEFKRIEHNNERELMELEKEFYDREKDLRAKMQQRLEVAIEEEIKSLRDEHHRLAREGHRTILREMEEAEQEHRRFMGALRDDLERELNEYRMANKTKNDRDRLASHSESRRGHEASQMRIRSMQATHEQEMASLRKDHDEKLKQIKIEFEEERAQLEVALRGTYGPKLSIDEDAIAEEAEAERDERIQKTIKSFQTDAIRLERRVKAEFEEERERIEKSAHDEYNALTSQRKASQLRLAELSSIRSALEEELEKLHLQSTRRKPMHELEDEIAVYEKGIETQRQRIRDQQLTHEVSVQDSSRTIRDAIEEYKRKCEETTIGMKDAEEDTKRQMSRIEDQHELDLENLERRVKLDVSTKDDEINVLRDAVHTEKVRAKKVKKLLQQYADDQSQAPGRV